MPGHPTEDTQVADKDRRPTTCPILREMQAKATRRHHLVPTRMAKIGNTGNTKC